MEVEKPFKIFRNGEELQVTQGVLCLLKVLNGVIKVEHPLLTTSLQEQAQIGARTVIHGATMTDLGGRVLEIREDGNIDQEAMTKKGIDLGMIGMC
jgi:hypothetical protein